MMRYALTSIIIGLLLCPPAFAADQCYSPDELAAEQLLRLHSELMVITVTCKQSSDGESLVPKYTGFTKINIHSLHDAEQTMISYYKKIYGEGVSHLDRLRTLLANEYGQQIADMSAPAFCQERRDKVVTMYGANEGDIGVEVARMVVSEKSYGHLCPGAGTRIAKHEQ